ncbi:hypothetical protein Zm00014a_029987 [Zea mays]|uniref:ZmGR2c protein n=1 Tax=Zea mays TaxID=4577 RepID=A0A3L6FE55_MAIZE|nr:hypothetical protein Zm00014a_029987 [Zea mays]PWZ30618.1 hypothetical protein Zm00014a_029987 [Zea mays]PWZ30619.1 hypothetical protein Zm00014a_029987 [Zea mays]PWZ30620.1 hypothetical protein Zm00014a_029987 [Zea mays]PWZ30621.1 hypothetical protein Zm00014a_029987 [Zea mays]
MFFQRKKSKKAKDSRGSQKKGKDGRGKNDLFDRAKGGLDALAGSLQEAKKDAETATEKLQGDVKSGMETIRHKGSGLLEKAKEELGSHSDASRSSKELERGSEEQGNNKDMDAFGAVMDKVKGHPEAMEKVSAVMDKVKSHPEMVEKVKDEVTSLAGALRLRRHGSEDKEAESEEKAEGGEAKQSVDEGASDGKAGEPGVLEQAVQEIQAVAAALQQTAEPEAEIPAETAAAAPAAETSAGGDRPEETNGEVEKDDPKKRLDFAGFFAMLLERFCSPASKKKD